jgi:hypothetical protein
MKKTEIFRKLLKTNPEKFRKNLGMIRRIPDILRGLFRNSPDGYWAHSGTFQKISANVRGFLGRGPSNRRVPVR